ncbi:MAG: bifunctional hydroxymethylpyrimidine kinase/phosphomethylpyrimidine kinase [Promethearchaeota archaeon]
MKNCCLTIAGSDPTSGAGIQADIRTFDRCGVHPFSAITAITFQTATKFLGYKSLSDDLERQLNAIFSAYPIKFVKIGMVPDLKALNIILDFIKKYDLFVVYDPISVSSSGRRLSIKGLELEIEKKLFPKVKVITPNLSEAFVYSKINYEKFNFDNYKEIGEALLKKLYSNPSKFVEEKAVIVKSLELDNKKLVDLVVINKEDKKKFNLQFEFYEKLRRAFQGNIHGSGCVFSSAIAAFLSKNYNLKESITLAEKFFDEKFQTFIELPDRGKVIDLTIPEEKLKVINQIKEIYNFISNIKKFSKLIPEVRLNISCSLPNAKSKMDIAGIDGRMTIVNDFPRASGEIKFGASDHTARLLLSAKKFDNSINLVINLKYSQNLVKKLNETSSLKLYEFVRETESYQTKLMENSTMQWLIEKTVEDTNWIPDIIWDKGEIGKEPIIRVFAKDSKDMINKLQIIIELIEDHSETIKN